MFKWEDKKKKKNTKKAANGGAKRPVYQASNVNPVHIMKGPLTGDEKKIIT